MLNSFIGVSFNVGKEEVFVLNYVWVIDYYIELGLVIIDLILCLYFR